MEIANRSGVDAFRHPRIVIRDVKTLRHASRNARTHSKKQIGQLADSIRAFGFVNPVLVDDANRIVAGHGRVEAARKLGITAVPVICLGHLNQDELRAYAIADNRLAELAGWDKEILALEFADLIKIDSDFDVSVTGFDHGAIDLMMQVETGASDPGDELPPLKSGKGISKDGDIWSLSEHRILCGDVRDRAAVRRLMGREKAKMVFTDPPYNVAIAGHASGLGRTQHRDFSCASGEMTKSEFAEFLEVALENLVSVSTDGSLHYVCMDWRHLQELTRAGEHVYSDLKNVCVWNKTNGGMGSMYRSKHELVFVYKSGRGPHVNNVELGRFGRYRSNVWDYAGVNTWRSGRDKDLSDHPTVKPILLVADAIQDASNRGDIVLDGFGGAGTTLIAAERLGRRARLIELEPRYVDVTIGRWQAATGQVATLLDSDQSPAGKASAQTGGHQGEHEIMKKNYKVGYGKPPKQTQFKPGQSGNPKGRPKQKRSLTAKIEHELKTSIVVTENGRSTKVSKGDALVKTLVAKAVRGDVRSVQLVINNSDSLRGHDALQPTDLDALDLLILEQYAQSRRAPDHA